MKFLKKILLPALAAAFLVNACQTDCLEIPQSQVGKRKVLLEELTGVDCPNCPEGTKEVNDLLAQHGHNLVAVAIHGGARGFFNKKIAGSDYDFNTDEMEQLVEQIGIPSTYPAAAINRLTIAGNTDIFNDRPWGGAISQAFQPDLNLALFIENQYNTTTRELSVEVKIAPEQTISGNNFITVYVVQDSIIDSQNDHGAIVQNYAHRHVLRKVLTDVSGNPISESLAAGATITQNFNYVLPADFDEKHCAVVAFVHQPTGGGKEVLQVEEKEILE